MNKTVLESTGEQNPVRGIKEGVWFKGKERRKWNNCWEKNTEF